MVKLFSLHHLQHANQVHLMASQKLTTNIPLLNTSWLRLQISARSGTLNTAREIVHKANYISKQWTLQLIQCGGERHCFICLLLCCIRSFHPHGGKPLFINWHSPPFPTHGPNQLQNKGGLNALDRHFPFSYLFHINIPAEPLDI